MDINEFLEDFDNEELYPSDRQEQLVNAVLDYNEQYNTSYSPLRAFIQYEIWKRKKYSEKQ